MDRKYNIHTPGLKDLGSGLRPWILLQSLGEIWLQVCWHRLFSDEPHTCLEETWWDEDSNTRTTRYYIIDAASGKVSNMASTTQAYTDDEYREILRENGFSQIEFYPSLQGETINTPQDLFVIVARN